MSLCNPITYFTMKAWWMKICLKIYTVVSSSGSDYSSMSDCPSVSNEQDCMSSRRADLWVEPGTCPESSTHQIKIQPAKTIMNRKCRIMAEILKTWKDIGNRIGLIHKEPIMEFVSRSDTMPLQIYKVFMMSSISVFRHAGLHCWAGSVDLI